MATVANPRTAEREPVPEPTEAERAVADLLPLAVDAEVAREVLDDVPFWFHTFSLGNGLYTPGAARDHRYRIPAVPEDLGGKAVLDVGAFDGFYSFLAEARGASRVVAVDNEQYRDWVRARWGIEVEGGEGLRAISRLIGSRVEYRRLDAFELDSVGEQFDLIFCFGILHRVGHPLGLLEVLRRRLAPGGRVLVETYGVADSKLGHEATIHVCEPGGVYARDEFVYWAFAAEGLRRLAGHAGFGDAEVIATPVIAGHPRILGYLT
ncbi:MAG TPA: DUF1698 domain-containing protein [Solirubrobacterales bacterium]|nr:DUF1698 domain-containing protein [Solirubrobacterales bacterium]